MSGTYDACAGLSTDVIRARHAFRRGFVAATPCVLLGGFGRTPSPAETGPQRFSRRTFCSATRQLTRSLGDARGMGSRMSLTDRLARGLQRHRRGVHRSRFSDRGLFASSVGSGTCFSPQTWQYCSPGRVAWLKRHTRRGDTIHHPLSAAGRRPGAVQLRRQRQRWMRSRSTQDRRPQISAPRSVRRRHLRAQR